jgi:hypothetical protein
MGRKGIGKLAGFGLAEQMTVMTWQGKQATEFTLDVNKLKRGDNDAKPVAIPGIIGERPSNFRGPTGTVITLKNLKHTTPLDLFKLREALARRFSRKIRGEMKLYVNGKQVGDNSFGVEKRIRLCEGEASGRI